MIKPSTQYQDVIINAPFGAVGINIQNDCVTGVTLFPSKQTANNVDDSCAENVKQQITQYFQNAQDFLVREIVNSKSKYFIEPTVVTVLANTEEYDYPTDIILQGIDSIEWSDNRKTWLFLEKSHLSIHKI